MWNVNKNFFSGIHYNHSPLMNNHSHYGFTAGDSLSIHMKGKTQPSPSPDLSFPDSKNVPVIAEFTEEVFQSSAGLTAI